MNITKPWILTVCDCCGAETKLELDELRDATKRACGTCGGYMVLTGMVHTGWVPDSETS